MNALTTFTPSASWRETTPNVWSYVLGRETVGMVQRVSDDLYFAEADRRRTGTALHLGRFESRLAAMAVVQDALIGPASAAAALGRETLAADPEPDTDDEHLMTAFDVLGHRWLPR